MLSIILLSFVMLVGCYLAGCIPLAFNLSSTKTRYLTIFGAGLLLGTALTVIIPEGIHTMYSDSLNKDINKSFIKSYDKSPDRKLFSANNRHRELNLDSVVDHMKLVNQAGNALPVHGAESKQVVGDQKPHIKDKSKDQSNQHNHIDEGIHRKIGISLVVGFIFMLIVDNLSNIVSNNKNNGNNIRQVVLESMSGTKPTGEMMITRRKSRTVSATIGLVMHAAADGVALGAASSISHFRVEMIIFLAIMLHKAPAAFGFVSFLLHENVERNKIRRYLLLFSLAAPIMAILTYLCLNDQTKEQLQEMHATGLALLFSAGTFLYVATVHVLPELAHPQHSPPQQSLSNDSKSAISQSVSSPQSAMDRFDLADDNSVQTMMRMSSGFTLSELILIVIGSLCPLLMSIGHSHE